MKLGAIQIHPVKSGRAVDLRTASVARHGLAGDRRWMLVDEKARFLSQRECPALALLEPELTEDGIILVYADEGERFVPTPEGEERLTVRIWRDTVDAALADEATNVAISRWLGRDVRLVYQDRVERISDTEWDPSASPVTFADGFPLLVATTASLRDLNRRLVYDGHDPVPMSRFRPNLVIDDTQAWAEDAWRTIRIGGLIVDLVKPCTRCKITTVDQFEGQVTGDEPLETLRAMRMSADRRVPGVLFGWDAVPRGEGRIDVGDRVEVIETREAEIVRQLA